MREKISSDREKKNWNLTLKAEGPEFEIFLRSLEQFIRSVKGQYNFWSNMLLYLVPGGLSDLIH